MQKEKAKRFLASALLALMEQKPYEKIHIREICAAAFLSRASFYKYYTSKDALLREQFRILFSDAAARAASTGHTARLAECLSSLSAYTQIIREQKLLTTLLPELTEMLSTGGCCDNDAMARACSEYIRLLYAVRSAPGMTPDIIARCWHEASADAPDILPLPPTKHVSAKREQNTTRLTQALLTLLDDGTPLARVSVKELTARAGVNRSSFYRCFAQPRDMFLQCMRKLICSELLSGCKSDADVLAHYRPYRALLTAAWQELGLEGFAAFYTSALNTMALLPDDDAPDEQLYVYRLRSVCFAAKRTALLYCFL